MISAYEAATICRATYAYKGDPAYPWDHFFTGFGVGQMNEKGIKSLIRGGYRDLEAAPHFTSFLAIRCRSNVTPESASGRSRPDARETLK